MSIGFVVFVFAHVAGVTFGVIFRVIFAIMFRRICESFWPNASCQLQAFQLRLHATARGLALFGVWARTDESATEHA